jgi:hypothetical protein
LSIDKSQIFNLDLSGNVSNPYLKNINTADFDKKETKEDIKSKNDHKINK